jgi:hypothetical protein
MWTIRATTAEDLREELVKWLDKQAKDFYSAQLTGHTKQDKAIAQARGRTYEIEASFWRNVHIEPKKG